MYNYIPERVCSRAIQVELDANDRVKSVNFIGGCDGNLKAIGKLVKGMSVDEVAEVLEGNDCKGRGTSCADQLVKALRGAQAAK
ncbi:MAG: TIGR03905 family TSCPD domain-containing protein [Coriobacteriaceae bacterium]|nr:TIGR03905 family TSCPD domain-containing protein [Coriobacteriaceae bacterium]MDO4891388.1 TIGR03905 family TSCPD domain-containing protein [Coriobacteriaceae bacterium]